MRKLCFENVRNITQLEIMLFADLAPPARGQLHGAFRARERVHARVRCVLDGILVATKTIPRRNTGFPQWVRVLAHFEEP
jgi:hypothetical protein